MYFFKVYKVCKTPESGGIFENFCVKSKLTVCEVTFNCKLIQKKWGAGCTSCSPNNNFVAGATAPPAPPVPAPIFHLSKAQQVLIAVGYILILPHTLENHNR